MHKLLRVEDTYFPTNKHLRLKDKLFCLTHPKVMGIINCTSDSFYRESRHTTELSLLKKVETFVNEGVDIIDIGGYSSRPNAIDVSIQEEIERILPAIQWIKKEFSSIPLSLDTFRSDVAKIGLENGIDIINDISAWNIDNQLLDVITHYKCPYILMHMQGTPKTMQTNPFYENFLKDILFFFSKKITVLHERGLHDIIIDPGFGFGKTMEQNYQLLNQLNHLKILGKPILAGISRKSMIYKKLEISPEESLNGTTALNTTAIQKGASILRVHDVKEAKQVIRLLDSKFLN